ncbi:MAG: methyltransferase domain-containing protein [Cyanobacteria bacterium REEB65]|nr:methyltransferase domain-containing protein [Cyanobacteria bacterium REEB65]
MKAHRPLHSIEHFGPMRKFWWHADFLELMSRRWNVATVRSVLDVGCGVGHWTLALSAVLPAGAQVVGVDREPEWIQIANAVAQGAAMGDRRRFQVGLAESLDFPDESFDLVTCQTLLIHLKDAKAALGEMQRVLKPGGLLLAVEPNNRVQALGRSSLRAEEAPAATLARVRFHVLCEQGRALLGEGDYSIGDLLPGLLHELGLKEIQVFQSDHAHGLWGDFSSAEQVALVEPALQEVDLRSAACSPWSPEDARRYFVAAGGSEEEFADSLQALETDERRTREAIESHAYHRAGGKILYLIHARKPTRC